MNRIGLFAAIATLGVSVGFAAGHGHGDGESVKLLSSQDIMEKLDGREAKVSFVEVTIAPEQAGVPHRHPGPGFVYVLEGDYELGINDQPVKRFTAGQTFYEPAGHLHRVSRNPSSDKTTRLLAVVVHPRAAADLAVPEP